jgi:hypothetical protein
VERLRVQDEPMGVHERRLPQHPANDDRQLEDESRIVVVDHVGFSEEPDHPSRRLDQELLSRPAHRSCATDMDGAVLLLVSQSDVARSENVTIDSQYSYVVASRSLPACQVFDVAFDTAPERPVALRDVEDSHAR